MHNTEIYDIETFKHAFILCSLNTKTLERQVFEISKRKNDIEKLITYIKSLDGQIGYNVINFDYPILHWLLNNYTKYNQSELPSVIQKQAQLIIEEEFSAVHPSKVRVPQLDLFRIWHYSNKARATSLKYLEFTMRMRNIEDLPYGIHDELTSDMIDKIIEYCHHDVDATYMFWLKSKGRISLRMNLQKTYGIPLMNRPDVGIAEDLVLHSYCQQTGLSKRYVKGLKTEYKFIQGSEVILPEIKFKTKDMQDWLESLKKTYLKRMDYFWQGGVLKLFGEEYQVGLGGLHINQKEGVYAREDNQFLTEWDCAGMYPTFIALHGMYPKHLGEEFLTLYRKIRDDRMAAKKSGDKIMDAAGKLMGNGTFGKFGSDLSYLYDLKMLYTTTLNNQLFLLMLIEECGLNDIKVISANTDSITIFDDKDKLPTFYNIRDEWEDISLHTLENTEYNKLVMRDVNNYLAETSDGKVKYKGAFDTFEDKESDKFDGWHKNHSMMIVPIALREYYVNNTPVEQTIKSHTDIFDFCKAVKGIGGANFETRQWVRKMPEIDLSIDWRTRVKQPLKKELFYEKIPVQKRVNRYIVSNKGVNLIKIMPPLRDEEGNNKRDKLVKYRKEHPTQTDIFGFIDDVVIEKNRESEVEAGRVVTMMNNIKSLYVSDYNINYQYYIDECYKIINQIPIIKND